MAGIELDVSTGTPLRGPDFPGFFATERSRLVRALAVTIGDAGRAADSVDEAMTRAWQDWDQVRLLDAPGGWVYRVALNHARSRWRRRRRETLQERPGVAGDRLYRDPPAPLDDELQRAVLGLPTRQREVVVLRLLLDLDTATTAALLEVAEGTVRSRLSRAVASLRRVLEVLP